MQQEKARAARPSKKQVRFTTSKLAGSSKCPAATATAGTRRRPRKEWDGTIRDLTLHQATPEEIEKRKSMHRSKNLEAARQILNSDNKKCRNVTTKDVIRMLIGCSDDSRQDMENLSPDILKMLLPSSSPARPAKSVSKENAAAQELSWRASSENEGQSQTTLEAAKEAEEEETEFISKVDWRYFNNVLAKESAAGSSCVAGEVDAHPGTNSDDESGDFAAQKENQEQKIQTAVFSGAAASDAETTSRRQKQQNHVMRKCVKQLNVMKKEHIAQLFSLCKHLLAENDNLKTVVSELVLEMSSNYDALANVRLNFDQHRLSTELELFKLKDQVEKQQKALSEMEAVKVECSQQSTLLHQLKSSVVYLSQVVMDLHQEHPKTREVNTTKQNIESLLSKSLARYDLSSNDSQENSDLLSSNDQTDFSQSSAGDMTLAQLDSYMQHVGAASNQSSSPAASVDVTSSHI